MKNSTKAKLSTREKQKAAERQEFEVTENTRNLEAQIATAGKPDPEEQLNDVIDLGDAVAGTPNAVSEETCPASCDTGDSDAQVCLSQSRAGCCVEQVTEQGHCAPVSDVCSGGDVYSSCE